MFPRLAFLNYPSKHQASNSVRKDLERAYLIALCIQQLDRAAEPPPSHGDLTRSNLLGLDLSCLDHVCVYGIRKVPTVLRCQQKEDNGNTDQPDHGRPETGDAPLQFVQ